MKNLKGEPDRWQVSHYVRTPQDYASSYQLLPLEQYRIRCAILSCSTPQHSPYSHSIVPGGFDVTS
jgi:hypothetical protein